MATEPTTIAPLEDGPRVVIDHATPPPITQGDDADTPPAKPGEGSSPEPETQETPPKADEAPDVPKSAREQLIAKLISVDDVKPEPEKEPEPEAAAAEKPEATETKTAEGETKPEKAPESNKDDELTELTNDTAKAMKPGEARRKINRLIERVKDSEPLAKGYKEIIDVCEKHGFAPEDYRAWVHLGIGIQDGNEAALKEFATLATKLGILPEAAAAPELPADLDTWLNSQIKDLEISPVAAAELRKKLGVGKEAPAAKPPVRQQQTQPERQPAPRVDPLVQARTKATNELGRIADEYEKKIGEARFKELEPRIKAELAKRQGRHPDAWPDIFRAVIDAEIARAPKPAAVNPGLRPGGSSTPATKQTFKTERERVIHQYTS